MPLSYVHVPNGDGYYGQLMYKTWDVTYDSSYPTGGEIVDPSQVGITTIIGCHLLAALDATSAGIISVFDFDNIKLLAMRVAGFTPAGTNAASTVTGNAVVVGGGIGEAIGINPDTNAGVLSKAAATNRTIPIATFLGASLTAPAQTFTGTAVAAGSLIEVANGVSLTAITHRLTFIGS